MVIHDCVWVDALTFARSKNSTDVASALSPFVKGFLVTSQDFYREVWNDVTVLGNKLVTQRVSDAEIGLSFS
jgi:hypothetical protein